MKEEGRAVRSKETEDSSKSLRVPEEFSAVCRPEGERGSCKSLRNFWSACRGMRLLQAA